MHRHEKMTGTVVAAWLMTQLAVQGADSESIHAVALDRVTDLRLSAYVTAASVQKLATDTAARDRSLDVLRTLGVTKVCLEVYRSGTVVPTPHLELVRDFLRDREFTVAAGIATVPGGDFGVRANEGLHWFNWQNRKTQRDLEAVVRTTAGLFDEFIVDDFLCTGDTSAESNRARGDRSWSAYRRDLLTTLSRTVFIEPAREVNPNITMIIKYPQWYDRFHLFGYDVARQPALFDRVWVGTETRGARTQRFGFTQPYEGFVNYRWLASLAGPKIGGAWFDHGDCDALDFIDQAWQTVLAGAPEIVLFNYGNLAGGHPGHALLCRDFEQLANLAREVRRHPVTGVGAYKPPNSDAGGDLYLMDFLGMLGVPLVPHSRFPEGEKVIFLPTQAAADPSIGEKVEAALRSGADLVFTTGFLATAKDGERFSGLAGVNRPLASRPSTADGVRVGDVESPVRHGLRLGSQLEATTAQVRLVALVDGVPVPFLTEHVSGSSRISVLNVHTYSQADFDAVGEVLLPPRPLGLLEIPASWAREVRRAFGDTAGFKLYGPTRITLQPLGNRGWFLQNYNDRTSTLSLEFEEQPVGGFRDRLSGRELKTTGNTLSVTLEPRSRLWLEHSLTEADRSAN